MSNPTGERKTSMPLALLVVLAFVLGMGLWAGVYRHADSDEAEKLLLSLGNAGLTLAVGGVLGGILKLIFDRLAQHQADHDATQVFYRNILDDVKAIHDEVERSRLLIEAHQSAKTYGEQMRKVPEALIRLRNIERALKPGFPKLAQELKEPVRGLSVFLTALLDEYRTEYIGISRQQSQDEATNRHLRSQVAQNKITADQVTLSTEAWAEIEKLSRLTPLRLTKRKGKDAHSVAYTERFLDHIDAASAILRKRLDAAE